MVFLLDINILIALPDQAHVHHGPPHDWFSHEGAHAWVSCPLTENGVLRIMESARYPKSPGTPAAVVESLQSLLSLPGRQSWPDDLSLLGAQRIDVTHLLNSSQITDSYLLALACSRGGQLATFDRRIVTAAVPVGVSGLRLI